MCALGDGDCAVGKEYAYLLSGDKGGTFCTLNNSEFQSTPCIGELLCASPNNIICGFCRVHRPYRLFPPYECVVVVVVVVVSVRTGGGSISLAILALSPV
jgi:hypothetical protein